jgi:hypothetical protein
MLLYRTERHAVAQDQKGRIVFNLESKKDCEMLQELTKHGFDLIMDRPYELLDCNTLEFENDRK